MISWFLPRALGECTLLKQTRDHHGSCIASPGELYIGGQEHFYLETHCSIAVPKGEAGEMELFVSTQNTMKTQVGVLWVSSRAWGGHWGASGRLGVGDVGHGKRENEAGLEGDLRVVVLEPDPINQQAGVSELLRNFSWFPYP